MKRAIDVSVSTAALVLMWPLLVVIGIAVKFDSPGPVLFHSDRIGKHGRPFKCLKFRSMVSDAEERKSALLDLNDRDGVLFKVKGDPRITRVGRVLRKYSLDELPQFWNVLKGDMSVVGPRPPLGSEVMQYTLNHMRRLDMTPGITGLWQVQARQDPSFNTYVALDLEYIDNWSIWLDIGIILRTIPVVFSGTGA